MVYTFADGFMESWIDRKGVLEDVNGWMVYQ